MSEEIKRVNITGGAATDMTGGKRTRRSTKKKQEGGSEELRGVSAIINNVKGVESSTSIAATAALPNSNTWLKYPVGAPVPPKINFNPEPSFIPSSPDRSAAPTAQYAQAGGYKHSDHKQSDHKQSDYKQSDHKQIKVELKKKTTAKKVHLNPKKTDGPKQSKKHQTRKIRKVTLGVSSLHKRITRAKKLHKKVKDMPIEILKEKLIKGGFIKPTSKAPESVLRQMAADAEVVKNKAL
jgi:hypothetical protein